MKAYRSLLIVIVALAALPLAVPLLVGAGLFAGPNTFYNLMIFILIITLAAQGWNIAGGYGGQFSFGHAAFFGTGAYVQAVLQTRYGINAWVALPLAMILGGLVGAVIGTLAFRARLRGSYFALVTLAFAEVFRILANATPITGGAAGTLVPLKIGFGQMQFATPTPSSISPSPSSRSCCCSTARSNARASAPGWWPCARTRTPPGRSASTRSR